MSTNEPCPKCNEIKPSSQFKRWLTKAEAKARGYSGERRVLVDTMHCKDCRPRIRVRPEAFTNPELREKVRKGEVNEFLANSIIQQRQARALAEQTAAARKRWEGRIVDEWGAMLKGIKDEIFCLTQQRRRARAVLRPTKPDLYEVVERYTTGTIVLLRRLRADLIMERRAARERPDKPRWQDYATKAERDQVALLWGRIPPNNAAKMRPPGLFAKDDRTRPVVPLIVEEATPPEQPMVGTPDAEGSVINPLPGILDHWDDV